MPDMMQLPVMTLPRAVPLQRERQPQDTIPQTRGEREQLGQIIDQYVERVRPVPPLSVEELRRHAEAVLAEAAQPAEVPRLRRRRPQQRRVARSPGHRAVRAAAAAAAQVPAGRRPLPGPVRRVRPALQAVRPLHDSGPAERSRAAGLRRASSPKARRWSWR